MTDDESTSTDDASAEGGGVGIDDAPAAGEAAPEEHPYFERYAVPFLMPLAIVIMVIAFVISISRIFLSAHDNAAVVAGTVITIAIMVGAAVLSYSSRMRASSRGLVMVIFLLGILGGGIVVVGASEEHDEGGGTLPPDTPANYGLQFESTSDLRFVPDAAEGQTGLAKITMTNRGGEHTFTFDDAATQFDSLLVSNVGQTDEAVAYFGEPGEYTFYCATPGHRAAGMEGVITVAGDPISLAEAEASAGGGGGEGGGSTETSAP